MFRTLLPLALLGLSGTALAQEIDHTTTGLVDLSEELQVDSARERGSSRGHASRGSSRSSSRGGVTRSARSNGNTRQMSRSDGQRSQTRAVQSNGNVSRSRTTSSVSYDQSRRGNTGNGTVAQRRAGGQTRTDVTMSNGDKSFTRSTGDRWSAAAQREVNRNGEVRTLGRTTGTEREGWKMTAPNGSASRGTKSFDTHDRGANTRGAGFDRRTSGARTTGHVSSPSGRAPERPAAIPASSRSPSHASGRRTSAGHVAASSGRVGNAPPRPGSGPGHARPSPPRHGHASAHVAPRTVVHSRPSSNVRVHVSAPRTHVRTVTYHHVRPYHGVFVYGPRPTTHVRYVDNGPVQVKQRDLPKRQIDRENSLAVGLRGGSLYSGYIGGNGYADLGLGLAARYRPDEAVGLELALQHHDQTWTSASERSQTMVAGSVELFAWPWTRVSPYVLGGLTYTARDITDEIYQYDGITNVDTGRPLVGPHAGLGLELALGQNVALDLEARYVGYLNRLPTDASYPGAFTTTAGVMVHF